MSVVSRRPWWASKAHDDEAEARLSTFFYSKKQEERFGNAAERKVLVDGHWLPYTEWKHGYNQQSAWDDAIVVLTTDCEPKLMIGR